MYEQHALLIAALALGCRSERTAGTAAPPGTPPPPPGTFHLVAPGILELDMPGPVLKQEGSHEEGGAYEFRSCLLAYSGGPHHNGLEPGALGFPDDYLHRVSPIDGLPVRWVTYRQADPMGREFWVEIYRPGVTVKVGCSGREARDEAVGWLATVRFKKREGFDRTGIKELVGPATFSPAPDLCTLSAKPPIGATSVATVRVELPGNVTPQKLELRSPATPKPLEWTKYDSPLGEPVTLFVPAGTYSIDIYPVIYADTDEQPPVRCAPVELKPGQVTTVRVQRFRI